MIRQGEVDQKLVGITEAALEESRRNWRIINADIPAILKGAELKVFSKKDALNQIKELVEEK